MRKRISIIAIAIIFFICCTSALAIIEPTEDFYVYDGANVLDVDTEGMIVFSNDILKAACGAEIVVVTVDSTNGEDIVDYSYDIANSWGIGDSKKNNGFFLLMAIEDDDYYALTGSGLDYELSSGEVDRMLKTYLEPYFAKKNYDDGTNAFFREIFKTVAEICDADVSIEQGIDEYERYVSQNGVWENSEMPELQYERSLGGEFVFGGLFFIIILIVVLLIFIFNLFRGPRIGHRHIFFGPCFWGPRPPRPPRPPHVHRHPFGGPRGPWGGGHGPFGGFGGGRSGGGGGFSGGGIGRGPRPGGFGGGRVGGGGGFSGGGAGRGR